MAIHYEINFSDDFSPHDVSLSCFYQDDGFGNCINTYNICHESDVGWFVCAFIDDMFYFV